MLGVLALLGFPGAPRLAFGAAPESPELEQHDLVLDGDRRLARRAMVLAPRRMPESGRCPVLVLLHGLGETGNERLGIHAWGHRYGLVLAYERLSHPPVARILREVRYLTNEHALEINRALEAEPFQPVILVCPVTPNPGRHPSASVALDAYAAWVTETLLPAVQRTTTAADLTRVGLDGCSLGGYVALELFLRRPNRFATLGTVQAAIGSHRAAHYADALLESPGRGTAVPIHVETSTFDPYRKANEALVRELGARGIRADLAVLPGPHNQPWLQEVGTLEMLRWHSSRLNAMSGAS
jgi:pimeloyl-ACP methyl ester carboxylesterase